jgi:hypothetical protein
MVIDIELTLTLTLALTWTWTFIGPEKQEVITQKFVIISTLTSQLFVILKTITCCCEIKEAHKFPAFTSRQM